MIRARTPYPTLLLGGCLYLASLNPLSALLQPIAPTASGELVLAYSGTVIGAPRNPDGILFTNGSIIREVTSGPDDDGIIDTGVGTDLAIRGAGWFVLRVPDEGVLVYTRSGDFRLDSEGHLITSDGYRVQGFNEPGARVIGDLQINARFVPDTTQSTATMTTFTIDRDGHINVFMSDGTEFRRGQILLQKFSAPDELDRVEYHLFASTAAALPASSLAAPGTGNLGEVEMSSLDVSPLKPRLKVLTSSHDNDPLLLGAVTQTGRATDLAVRGPGAFLVRDPMTSELFATRAGMFLVDSNNFLITYDRKRLQGRFHLPEEMLGDIQVGTSMPETTAPGAVMTSITIARDGSINVHFSDGTEASCGQIALYDFDQPEKLHPVGLGQFAGVIMAQPFPLQNVGRFGSTNSWIYSGTLELVNVTSDLLARRRQLSFFQQGALYRTKNALDLAIDGVGFFLVQHPVSGRQFAARKGNFTVDAEGFLANNHGLRLQGYPTATTTDVGDLRIDPYSFLPLAMVRIDISRDGWINAHLNDGTEQRIGQVLLVDFKESFMLREVKDGLYRNLAAAQPRTLAAPGTLGLGSVESSALELPSEPEQLSLPPRDGFRFMISGEPGSRWIVQATDDLRHWRQIGVVKNAAFETEFCDQGSRQHQARAYRVQAEFALPQFNPPTPIFSNSLTNSGPTCPTPKRSHHR